MKTLIEAIKQLSDAPNAVAMDSKIPPIKKKLRVIMRYKKAAEKRSMRSQTVTKSELKDLVSDDVDLITSIPKSKLPDVERWVKRVVNGQSSQSAFENFLVDECGVSEERAELIANDQLNKAESQMRLLKMAKGGYTSFRWQHGSTREPREYHLKNPPQGLNGKVFRLDDPPVIDKETGERGFPGQLIGCHCRAIPVK